MKIGLLFLFSILIFFTNSWWSMVIFAMVVVACLAVARIPIVKIVKPLVPVLVLATFAVFFAVVNAGGPAGLSPGLLAAVRMVVLVTASFVVCLTSTSIELLDGFAKLIAPLRKVRVPVDDIAFTLALAIRFIPVIAEEFAQVRRAQIARGADVAGMSPRRRLVVWSAAFSSLFVGLFRHADALAVSMEARCYGAASRRGKL